MTRTDDIRKIASEANAVGLETTEVSYYGEDCDNSFSLKVDDRRVNNILGEKWPGMRWTLSAKYARRPAILSGAEIDELALTSEQVFFLNWSSEWATEIWSFWDGKTDFETIEEFIQHLKDTAENIYGPPIVKSANKRLN